MQWDFVWQIYKGDYNEASEMNDLISRFEFLIKHLALACCLNYHSIHYIFYPQIREVQYLIL